MVADLIAQAKQGDRDAFNRLIDMHREALFRYAYLIVRSAAVAEDVTQEAVLRIYSNLKRFDESGMFLPWALAITRNLARNNNRAWGRYKHMLIRFLNQREENSFDVENWTQHQQQAAVLHQAVSQLADDYQDVIYARYFLELSVEDSANMLGIAVGTVKSRSHRALKQLKGIIERDYPQLAEEFDHDPII